jgi:PAS domain S-box-containing protein
VNSLDTNGRSEMHDLDARNEVLRLRRIVRDLVALSALPSIWVDCDLERSLQNLTDVLRTTLRALTVCVRIELPGKTPFDAAACDRLSQQGPRASHAAELLDQIEPDSIELVSLPRFNGSGAVNALPHPIFAHGKRIGTLVACFREDFSPEENERLILQVAANQVTLLLQRQKAQEEQFARKLAEERLRETEHHYQQLVQSLPAAVYTCDNEGRITLYNEAAVALWGRRPIIGEDLWCGSWKIFQPDGSPLPLDDCPMAIAIREGRPVRGHEIIVERPDGTRSFVLPHPEPIRDETGRIVGTVNMLVTVDELKRVEQALRAGEARLQSLLNLMPAAVYACDAEGRITFFNRRAAELWGREPRLNDDHQKFCAALRCWFNGSVLAPENTPMAIAVREGKSFRDLEPVFERPDGVRVPVLVNIDPLFDADGKPAGAINVFQDVSPLKRAEDELRRKNAQLATFLETAALGLHRVGPDGTILWANAAEMQMLGYAPQEYIGHHIAKFHADQAIIDDILTRLTRGESICEHEARLRCKDGSIKHVLIDSSVLLEDGKFLHSQCFTRDVTDRKRAEEELARSERELALQVHDLQRLHQRSARLVGQRNLNEVFDEVLAAALEVHGTDRGLLSMFDAQLDVLQVVASGGFSEEFLEIVQRVPIGAGACGTCFKDKKRIVVEDTETDPVFAPYREAAKVGGFRAVHSTPLVTRDSRIIGVLSVHFAQPRRPTEREIRLMELYARQVADVIEEARLRDALARELVERKRAEEKASRLAAIVQHSDDAIFSTDLSSIINSWNRGAERLYGYTAAEVIGRPVGILVPEDRHEEELDMLARIRRGEAVENYETIRRRKDGALFDVSLTVSPVKDSQGNVIGISKVARDITDKVRAKEKLEDTVAERTASLQKAMKQLEEFSYSVSHDLRAPLRAIEGYTRILNSDHRELLPPDARQLFDRITRNTGRMHRLINDVLTLSRVTQHEIRLQPTPLRPLIDEVIEQHPNMRPPAARIEFGELATVDGDDLSLSQALSNLLTNAVKFVPRGVTPHVKIWTEPRGDRVRLCIEDNGIGIKSELQGKLFGVFQRLNPQDGYEGTGIGLAIVRKAVERMGGAVGVESDGTSGSRFWIELRSASNLPQDVRL